MRDTSGKPLTSRDLEYSFQRAALASARPLLRPFGTPRRDGRDRELVVFPRGNAEALARALSSPLCAVVRAGFDPTRPLGTGAFSGRFSPRGLTLERNLNAARGAALLDLVEVESASDLADALRRFEAETTDVGWLGRGLHRTRPESDMFRSPPFGWLVLRAGKEAGAWAAPGVVRELVAGIDPRRLDRFGLVLPSGSGSARYAGPPTELLARSDSAHLVELGEALTQLVSAPGATMTVRKEEPASFARRIARGEFAFALDFVRAFGPTREQRYLSLLAAADSALLESAPTPPVGLDGLPLALHATQATRTAVLSEFRVVAGKTARFSGLASWDLGAVYRQ
jgi:peptide/nickel transport system substrate-binding protein